MTDEELIKLISKFSLEIVDLTISQVANLEANEDSSSTIMLGSLMRAISSLLASKFFAKYDLDKKYEIIDHIDKSIKYSLKFYSS